MKKKTYWFALMKFPVFCDIFLNLIQQKIMRRNNRMTLKVICEFKKAFSTVTINLLLYYE